ncbi:MAG TPA: hypothetical protein VFD67_01190 [Gemmatimonadaceae bacterium]|nr:hypothetical protein [Gemmatimonadaceae bacterium]
MAAERFVVAAASAVAAAPACAHGFGQRYELPLPLSLYLWATAAAIVLSFVVAAIFLRRPIRSDAYPRLKLPDRVSRLIVNPWLEYALSVASAVLFLAAVAAGFWGNPDPYQNIAPTLIWVVGWVGLVYVSAFVGGLWPPINPWRTLSRAAEWLARKLPRGRSKGPVLDYPESLGVWPAFALLLVVSWTELVYPSPALPLHIGWLIVAYSLLTWTGMALYGREVWLAHGELFTVLYGIFSRFAPTEVAVLQRRRELSLRPFAAGLMESRPASPSQTALVLLILATVLYDGALATPEWLDVETRIMQWIPGQHEAVSIALRTIGLAASWCVFFGAYFAVCAIMSAVAGRGSAGDLARRFAWTLVPIAIAYHVAHYLVYLLTQGQYIVALASDPLGRGWNLFGTAGHRADIGLVGARFAWYTAVIAIVVGHVIAVVLAHHRAMRSFEARGVALRSQVPLTALMVAYTFVSLSILAEPITEQRAYSEGTEVSSAGIVVPVDAVLPQAGTGTLQSVAAGSVARQKLTYRVLGSAFHDGSKTSAADLLYAFMFAYRWGVPGEAEAMRYDPAIDAATAPLRQQLVGLKIVGTDTTSKSFRVGDVDVVRELFIIDVYTNHVPDNPEQDAAFAPPWSTVPWHVLVLMEEAVGRGWAAFSKDEAARRGVEWLDLVRSGRINRQLASLVEGFERDGYRPDALRPLVTAEDARKRWAALAAFYRVRGHFLVTNGPYQIKRWSDDSVELDVFRDLSYPLGVGSFDSYAIPRRGFITKVEREADGLRLHGEIETIMKFQRSYEIHREALEALDPEVVRRSAPEFRYAVLDGQGRAVLGGVVHPSEDRTFRLPLESEVAPGSYTVQGEIVVNGNAMNAEIRRIPVDVSAGR